MNKRAGWFRLWVVATVCWVVGVIAIGVQAVGQSLAGSKYIYEPWEREQYLPYNPPPEVDDGRTFRMDDGTELYIHRFTGQYGHNPYVDPIVEEFWRRRWHRYWNLVRPWLLLFAAPGVLFVVAYVVVWIRDGFGKAS